jgi:hypothetical protein
MPVPSESRFPQFKFVCHGVELCIALFDYDAVAWPGIVYPSLLKRVGVGQWQEIDKRDPMWDDIKEDIDPVTMANLIVADFNQSIALLSGGAELTYEQKLAAELMNGFKVVNNQLVRV